MFLETFLYDHIAIATAVLLLALGAAQARHLIDGYHYLIGCALVSTGATYLHAVHDGLSFAMGFNLLVAGLLWGYAYRTRPPRKVPDGTHEAL